MIENLTEPKFKVGDRIFTSVIKDNFCDRVILPGEIIEYIGIRYRDNMFAKISGNPEDGDHYYLIITGRGRVCNFEKDIKVIN
jgi:hypothetical protein